MLYSQQELDALLENEGFVNWILGADDAHWQQWMQESAAHAALARAARDILLPIRDAVQEKADHGLMADEIWQDVQTQLKTKRLPWLRYAAAVVVLMSAGFWMLLRKDPLHRSAGDVESTVNTGPVATQNTGTGLRTVFLPDSTRVTLSANSSVEYKMEKERIVHLKGEAFFDVRPDASHPFLVYSGNIVTKVLGTSFRMVDDKLVAVRSGRVQVVSLKPVAKSFMLFPNQQVAYDNERKELLQSGVTNTALLIDPATPQKVLHFDEAPVSRVLDTLGSIYSIDIKYDSTAFAKCIITVALDQPSLEDQLKVLCKVIGATYEMLPFSIYIKGQGCL